MNPPVTSSPGPIHLRMSRPPWWPECWSPKILSLARAGLELAVGRSGASCARAGAACARSISAYGACAVRAWSNSACVACSDKGCVAPERLTCPACSGSACASAVSFSECPVCIACSCSMRFPLNMRSRPHGSSLARGVATVRERLRSSNNKSGRGHRAIDHNWRRRCRGARSRFFRVNSETGDPKRWMPLLLK